VEIADGVEFVNASAERFDVIISDCTDPVGPGTTLFESRFYAGCRRCLRTDGIFVAQNGVPWFQLQETLDTWQRLAPHFADRAFYLTPVPIYVGGAMAFAWASNDPQARRHSPSVLAERHAASGITTRYYTPRLQQAAFALPACLAAALPGCDQGVPG